MNSNDKQKQIIDDKELDSLYMTIIHDNELKNIVNKFESEKSDDKRIRLVDRILSKWINENNIECSLNNRYEQLRENIYAQFMQETHLAEYYNLIDKRNIIKYDLSKLVKRLEDEIEEDRQSGINKVKTVFRMLNGLGITETSNFYDSGDSVCFYDLIIKNGIEK